MPRLMMILISIGATTLIGVGASIALTTSIVILKPILLAAAIGFVLVSRVFAKKWA